MKISIFTPTHDATYLPQAFKSLAEQSYANWEWIVLLNNGATFECKDPRVKCIRDVSGISRIGYLKHEACQRCAGDVLLEFDHDDELMPGALEEIAKTFSDKSVDFAYSNTINFDVRNGQSATWPERYGWKSRTVTYQGRHFQESVSSPPDPQSISRIWFAPNHFRAWRESFYWRIGGHDPELKVCDDQDLICRTYIYGKMVHVDKPLYFYRIHGENTWLKHRQEIQSIMWGMHDRYIYQMAMKWAKERGLRCIDLCGGINKQPGYESVDIYDADVISDLNQRWPFEDNSVGFIRAHDAIEHLVNPIHTMNEAYRVLAHGGFFLIQVPSTEGVGADCDPTHVSRWNRRSFRYYTESSMQRYIAHAGAKCRFQAIKVENRTLYDNVIYVLAHLVAIKADAPRFYGELLI